MGKEPVTGARHCSAEREFRGLLTASCFPWEVSSAFQTSDTPSAPCRALAARGSLTGKAARVPRAMPRFSKSFRLRRHRLFSPCPRMRLRPEREGETREREAPVGCLPCAPTGGQTCNLGTCPTPNQSRSLRGAGGAQPAGPPPPGLERSFFFRTENCYGKVSFQGSHFYRHKGKPEKKATRNKGGREGGRNGTSQGHETSVERGKRMVIKQG